jgi:hypothetical protein
MASSDFTLPELKLPDNAVYRIVTTGVLWRFLKLDGTKAAVDVVKKPIQTPGKIFGNLTSIALGDAASRQPLRADLARAHMS